MYFKPDTKPFEANAIANTSLQNVHQKETFLTSHIHWSHGFQVEPKTKPGDQRSGAPPRPLVNI